MVTHKQDPDLTVIFSAQVYLLFDALPTTQYHKALCYVACIPRTVERASTGKSGVGEQLFPLTYKGIYINIYQSINL